MQFDGDMAAVLAALVYNGRHEISPLAGLPENRIDEARQRLLDGGYAEYRGAQIVATADGDAIVRAVCGVISRAVYGY